MQLGLLIDRVMPYDNEKNHNYRHSLKSNKFWDNGIAVVKTIQGSYLKCLFCAFFQCQLDLKLIRLFEKGIKIDLKYRKTCKISQNFQEIS